MFGAKRPFWIILPVRPSIFIYVRMYFRLGSKPSARCSHDSLFYFEHLFVQVIECVTTLWTLMSAVGWLFGSSVLISHKAGKLHRHVPIGALIYLSHRPAGRTPTRWSRSGTDHQKFSSAQSSTSRPSTSGAWVRLAKTRWGSFNFGLKWPSNQYYFIWAIKDANMEVEVQKLLFMCFFWMGGGSYFRGSTARVSAQCGSASSFLHYARAELLKIKIFYYITNYSPK